MITEMTETTEIIVTLINNNVRKYYYLTEDRLKDFKEWLMMNGELASLHPVLKFNDPEGNESYLFRSAIATVYISANPSKSACYNLEFNNEACLSSGCKYTTDSEY